ncbi:hypothetical protein TWF730_010461 [Orbilia blumenaviensis]|uniref:PD-(D/E)XK nuclease-like domain-containing protein n=1 Tax=Orbilia blumenaviensis TaxID=1796055 RepID=A0AAV9UPA3_9PEZI
MDPEHEQSPEHARVLDWILAADTDASSFSQENLHLSSQSLAPVTPSRALDRLRIAATPCTSKKRKRSGAGTGTPNRDDENELTVTKKQQRVQELSHPSRTSRCTEFDAGENVFPADSVSQLEEGITSSSRTNTFKTAASSGTPKLGRIEMLKQSTPRFSFLGLSGKGGLASNANKEKVPADLQRIIRNLRASFGPIGLMCCCVEETICEQWPYECWVEGTFRKRSCNNINKRKHTQEAEFVIQVAQKAENLQSRLTEETGWLTLTQNILEHVSGPTQEHYPVTIEPVTTVDIKPEMLPTFRSASSPHPCPRSLATKPRGPRFTPSISPGRFTARADIAVNVNLENSEVGFVDKKIVNSSNGYPTPFTHAALSPVLTISCKSQDSDGLDPEFRSILCASALLESWSRLGISKSMIGSTRTPAPSSSERYPKRRRNVSLNGVAITQETGLDHIFTLQVVAYMWSFSVVFTDVVDPTNKIMPQQRTVVGPFHIGDIRTPTGVYAVLRFLDKLFKYKTSVWLPGMLERDAYRS